MYAHPEDCQKFYVCLNGVTPREQGCSLGQVYNEETGKCDEPENVPGWLVPILFFKPPLIIILNLLFPCSTAKTGTKTTQPYKTLNKKRNWNKRQQAAELELAKNKIVDLGNLN